MKNTAAFLLLCAFLMGCDAASNPFREVPEEDAADAGAGAGGGDAGDAGGIDGGGGTISGSPAIPATIAGNVGDVTFDPATQTLTVTGVNLDNVPIETVYSRTPSLDRDGFIAFTAQDDPLDRHFTALVGSSANVTAAAVSSPAPRNRTFIGAFLEREGAYDPPEVTEDSGLVTYAGSYVGVTNVADPFPQNLLSTDIQPAELQPGQALTVDGDVLLNADFADNQVEGNIINRRLISSNGGTFGNGLPSLVLIVTPIETDGSFNGSVEYDVLDPRSGTNNFINIGEYTGVFAGENASQVGGAISINEFDAVGDIFDLTSEIESGVFILEACSGANANPICSQIP